MPKASRPLHPAHDVEQSKRQPFRLFRAVFKLGDIPHSQVQIAGERRLAQVRLLPQPSDFLAADRLRRRLSAVAEMTERDLLVGRTVHDPEAVQIIGHLKDRAGHATARLVRHRQPPAYALTDSRNAEIQVIFPQTLLPKNANLIFEKMLSRAVTMRS